MDRETGYDNDEADYRDRVDEYEQQIEDARAVIDLAEVYREMDAARLLMWVSRMIRDGVEAVADEAERAMVDAEAALTTLVDGRRD